MLRLDDHHRDADHQRLLLDAAHRCADRHSPRHSDVNRAAEPCADHRAAAEPDDPTLTSVDQAAAAEPGDPRATTAAEVRAVRSGPPEAPEVRTDGGPRDGPPERPDGAFPWSQRDLR